MKKFCVCICVTFLMVLVFLSATAETPKNQIEAYFTYYDFQAPDNISKKIDANFKPKTIDCGEVELTISEILYDGCWLYTASVATPKNSDQVLIMPGSAWIEDLVSGNYQENERQDNRTFIQAAKEEQKKLLCIYAYPKEFDDLPFYFIDHFQRKEDTSVLISGGEIPSTDGLLSITFGVEIYEVDLQTGELIPSSVLRKECSTVIKPLSPLKTKKYTLSNNETSFPYSLILTKTGLTVYASVQSKDSEQIFPEYRLLNDKKEVYREGPPPTTTTYTMDNLPDTLYIQFYDSVLDQWDSSILCTAY